MCNFSNKYVCDFAKRCSLSFHIARVQASVAGKKQALASC